MHASRHAIALAALVPMVVLGAACMSDESSAPGASPTRPAQGAAEPTTATPPITSGSDMSQSTAAGAATGTTDAAVTSPPSPTETPATDPPAATESVPSVPGPPIHEPLAALIPDVDGYLTAAAKEVYWPAYDLPGGARAYAADITAGGDRIGQLVIADGSGANQLAATYIGNLFRDGAQLVRDTSEVGEGTFVVTNVAPVAWQAINDAAVIVGTIEQDDVGAWTWEHDGRIWAVRGRIGAAGDYAGRLIESTGAGADPFNFQGLTGRLLDRFPVIPGYRYVDLPRPTVLAEMANMLAGSCAESAYLGYVVVEDDPDPLVMAPEDLRLNIESVSPGCVDGGFVDDLVAGLDAEADLRQETLGGRDVYRNDTGVLHVDGRVIINLFSPDPATIVAMEPFITTFLAQQ